MAYLHSGEAAYPLRIGHEWSGTVRSVGPDVDEAWVGRRVTGDTMLGCGRCDRCRGGRQHLCADRFEVGIRNGWPGALAEQLAVPATSLLALPDAVDDSRWARSSSPAATPAGAGGGRGRARRAAAGARSRADRAAGRADGTRPRAWRCTSLAASEPRCGSPSRSGSSTCGPRRRCRPGRSTPWSTRRTPPPLPALARGPRRARAPGGLHWPVRPAQPRRHPAARAQGRHRDRDAQRAPPASPAPSTCSRPGRVDPRAAGRRPRRPARGRGGPRRGAGDPAWGAAPKVHVDPRRLRFGPSWRECVAVSPSNTYLVEATGHNSTYCWKSLRSDAAVWVHVMR